MTVTRADDGTVAILLVESREDQRQRLETLLAGENRSFVHAASAGEAVQRAGEQDFAVVILDAQLPGKGGFETASALRQEARSQSTPILFLTSGEHDRAFVGDAYRLGKIDLLFAPIIPEILQAKVDFFIEHFCNIRELRRKQQIAEQANLRAEDRFEFVRRSSGVGFWYCDLPFDVLDWDDQVRRHFHLMPGSVVTIESFYDRIHPDDRERVRTAIAASIRDRGPYDIDYRTVHPTTGAENSIRAIGRTFYDESGAAISFDGVTIDMTARVQAEEINRRSEQRAIAILESVTDSFFALDKDWKFTYVNPQALTTLEHTPEDLLGNSLWDLFPGLAGSDFEKTYHQAMLDQQPAFVTAFYPDHNRWYEVNVYPSPDGLSIYFRNITARMASEAALREGEKRLQAAHDLLEAITEGTEELIAAVDTELRITAVNTAYQQDFKRIFGTEAVIGATMPDLLAHLPEDKEKAIQLWKSALAGESILQTAEFGDPGRERRIFDLRFYPLKDAAGNIYGAGEIARDVTERVRADAELARLNDRLREVDRRKDEFLATLAHELRNPLAPIRNGIRILQLSRDRVTSAQTLEMMNRQLEHMVRLVDDLLDVSRITSGKVALKKQMVSLQAVLETAIEGSRPAIEAGGHELVVTLPDPELKLVADPTRLAQVVSNLLNNAAKYTPANGRIEVSARDEAGLVVIEVVDNGVGVPEEMASKIFELFTQVGRTIDRAQGGLGIGLSLVRHLVEMHGGTASVESSGSESGTKFSIRLPITERPGELSAATSQPDPIAGNGRRILVIDDNVDGADSLAMLLDMAGHRTEKAYTGVDGLSAALSSRPDVIFLDIGLPGLNGYEVAKQLRSAAPPVSAVLVALTGWGAEDDKRLAREAGFDFHLTKPVDADEVERLLARLTI